MPISLRRSVLAGPSPLVPALLLALSLTAFPAIGQDTPPPSALQKQLDKVDLSVVAAGEITSTVSGIELRDANISHTMLTIKPSTTVGELATLRYIAKPYVGFEFNFGNLRYSQDYTFNPAPEQNLLFGGVQSGVRELTLGYVAHPGYHPFGFIKPFVGAGAGTTRFQPTIGGGNGLPFQYRMTYYYNLGLEGDFPGSNFGMRLGFRQLFYLAPDFLENYLTITRLAITSEPIVGFYVRF